MTSDVVIERVGPESVARFEPMWEALRRHHVEVVSHLPVQSADRSWAIRRALYEHVLSDHDAFALVAVSGGVDVGYAVVAVHAGPDDTWVTGERIAEVETLSVLASARGSGVGTALLDRVDVELAAIGIRDLRIAVIPENSDAVRFYERRGLRPFLTVLGNFPPPAPAQG
jgi:ribosomal protein S18 acetylase RimI-like enzyme